MTQSSIQNSRGKVTFLGRASMRIEFTDGPVVYIDPYAGSEPDYALPADLVLVTHQHGDHNQIQRVCLKPDGKVLQCPVAIQPGSFFESHGIEVHVVDAYNENHKKGTCAGFIIKGNETVLYHSGDTSFIEEMNHFANYGIDYAFLCMDGYYNMGHEEAQKVANTIKAACVIPIHTSKEDLFEQTTYDAFSFEPKRMLKPGESFYF